MDSHLSRTGKSFFAESQIAKRKSALGPACERAGVPACGFVRFTHP